MMMMMIYSKQFNSSKYYANRNRFYNLLVREKIFTLRNLFYYKNDEQRKAFPYSYLCICDIEDTLLFN